MRRFEVQMPTWPQPDETQILEFARTGDRVDELLAAVTDRVTLFVSLFLGPHRGTQEIVTKAPIEACVGLSGREGLDDVSKVALASASRLCLDEFNGLRDLEID